MKHSNLIFAVLAIGLCITLVFADNLQSAYALSVTAYTNGVTGDTANAIIRCGNTIITSDATSADLNFFSASSPSTHLGEIVTNGGLLMGCSVSGDRAYVYTGAGTLTELDVANIAILRTLATGCDISAVFPTTQTTFMCGTSTATDTVKIISLASMAVTYTSSSLDAGATPCNDVLGIDYRSTIDTLFATCGNDVVVAVVGFTTSGTPDASASTNGVQPNSVSFDYTHSKLLVCDSSTGIQWFDYSGGVITGATAIADPDCSTNFGITYNAELGWFVIADQSTDEIVFLDAGGETQIVRVGTNPISASSKIQILSISQIYIAPYVAPDFFVMDATGISLGEGGEIPAGTGIDCTLPENQNILICRLGGDGSLVGAGNYIVGNVNGTTGLTPIICATGIVDCVANPDMKTNGVGYLLVTIALGIIIGILWVASRGDLNSIPTFIWFIATLAVVGAFTLMDLIDATFLVITAIIVVALAAAKVRGLFGGEFR